MTLRIRLRKNLWRRGPRELDFFGPFDSIAGAAVEVLGDFDSRSSTFQFLLSAREREIENLVAIELGSRIEALSLLIGSLYEMMELSLLLKIKHIRVTGEWRDETSLFYSGIAAMVFPKSAVLPESDTAMDIALITLMAVNTLLWLRRYDQARETARLGGMLTALSLIEINRNSSL